MPELPDITVYVEALERRVVGKELRSITVRNPFLLRTVQPPMDGLNGRTVESIRRIGKRIALGVAGDLWLVLHLMIAGRLHWHESRPKPGRKNEAARFEFASGWLTLTEAGTKKRASIHIVEGLDGLADFARGGLEVQAASLEDFRERLLLRNHTLKRALTDPSIFSGIGNAYSDEILHAAKLSPVQQTSKLNTDEIQRLFEAILEQLATWTERLRKQTGDGFPEGVTAFRQEMVVHGKYGKPCPECGEKVQRIRRKDNEVNYCPGCQTGGRLLADRGLSQLLKQDWPATPEELEELRARKS